MKQKTGKRFLLCAVMLLAVMLLAVPTQAAARYKKQWKKQNQNIYYYNEKGKKLTGLSKIGKKTFYFDQKGAQHVGWQKISNDYYYFNIARGSNGSMVKSARVNGITIDRTGKAKKDSASLRRLRILLAANQTVERITKPLMSKKEKLKICFEYAKKNFGYFSWRGFSPRNGWEMDFAEDMFFRGKGNCFSYGAAFAFMASAVGYKEVYAISSGGHGWAEVNGKVYDPDWALASSVDTYFAMPYSLSGRQGRPNYLPNRAYVSKI